MLLLKATTLCSVCNVSSSLIFAIKAAQFVKICFISTSAVEFNSSAEMFWFASNNINYNTIKNYLLL